MSIPVLLAAPFTFHLPGDYTVPGGVCDDPTLPATPFVCRLNSAITKWFDNNAPAQSGAQFVFDIALYSRLNVTQPMPILELSNLTLPVAMITPPL